MSMRKAAFCHSSGGYRPVGVHFDGSNDYLSYASDFTGLADAKTGTLSFWFNPQALSTDHFIFSNGNSGSGLTVFIDSAGTLTVRGENVSSSTVILDVDSGSTFATDAWHHAFIEWDLANASNRSFMIDGSDDSPAWNTYTDDLIDYTKGAHTIGSRDGGNEKYNGYLADFCFFDTRLDQATYLSKFYNSVGQAVLLGGDGSVPTGTPPEVCLQGALDDWHTNKSGNGGFSVNGALAQVAGPNG